MKNKYNKKFWKVLLINFNSSKKEYDKKFCAAILPKRPDPHAATGRRRNARRVYNHGWEVPGFH